MFGLRAACRGVFLPAFATSASPSITRNTIFLRERLALPAGFGLAALRLAGFFVFEAIYIVFGFGSRNAF
jgi:hypothetical protein